MSFLNDESSPDIFDPELATRVEKAIADGVDTEDEQLRAFIARRKQAYHSVFGDASDEDVQFVIEDLALFSHAFQSTFDPNPDVRVLREGRKEVFWRIFEHVRLPFDTLYVRYTNAVTRKQQG